MKGNQTPIPAAATPRPEVFLPGGYFVSLNGQDYLSMVWGDGSATVQVEPGQNPPGSDFKLDESGWSRKVYPRKKLGRVFHRETYVVWEKSLWYVPEIFPDQFRFTCLLSTGYVPIETLDEDPRIERGDGPTELWAHLTLDDIEAVSISETEIIKGHKDESTTRQIYTWRRNAGEAPPPA